MLEKLLQRFLLKTDKNNSKKISLNSLAPKVLSKEKDIERVQPYLTALKNSIDESSITNIAITGAYGSGKSTIIKTFQNLNPNYNYLNISLASFNESNDNDELERLLEVSILQQIFYHVKPSDIPDSRFKRIINNTDEKIWIIAISLILWVSSVFILFKFEFINKINPNNWTWNFRNIDWLALLVFIIFFSGIGLFSKTVVRLFSNSKINKLNIKGELELGDNIDKSVFNQHIEEILYFFERTKYNVVVIEDLDRFESTDIFTKLREINILLNNSNSIQKARKGEKINFLYAIKDDMFKDKNERVKFFEYIIPVIPFINPSNADEQLSKLIKEGGLEGILSKEFISDVITFIDDIDMRLLINIFHEFVLYRNTLNPEFVTKPEELFAVITYKNLYPRDFMQLHKREGQLYQLLHNKGQYTEELIKDLDEKILQKKLCIANIEDEHIKNLKDLRIIYLNSVIALLPKDATLSLAVNFENLTDDDNFEKYVINSAINYNLYSVWDSYRFSKSTSILTYSFEDIEKKVNPDFTYSERVKLLFNKGNDEIENLKSVLEKLKLRKQEIQSWDLSQIFEEISITPYLNDFSDSQLMRNLLLNGYINENYNDYISLFHGVNLTSEDFIFEKNVKSAESLSFDYKLTNIDTLVSKIPEKYFSKESILNFDLVDYLGRNYGENKAYFNAIINVLSNEKENSIDFIDAYLYRKDIPVSIFIRTICKSWKGFIDFLYTNSIYTEEKVNYYLEQMLRYASVESIVANQNTVFLADLINENPSFLSLIKNDDQTNYYGKITSLFKELDVKFDTLVPSTDGTRELFKYVYENHHYQINDVNVELFIQENNTGIEISDLKKSNYNSILNSNCIHLIDYIEANINEYVKNIFLKLKANIDEPEESFVLLLNDDDLDNSLKQDIIKKYAFKINTLSEIEETEVKIMLLEANKITPIWDNVINYYIDSESILEKTIINFLNIEENYLTLSEEKMQKDGHFEYAEFRKKLLLSNELTDESYKKILESSIYTRDELAFENLSIEKVKYLVEKILSLSVNNFNLLKSTFPNQQIDHISQHQAKFITDFESYTLDENDIILLLGLQNKIENANKIEIINKIDIDLITGNKEIAKIITAVLSHSHYLQMEYQTLEVLFKNTTSIENRVKLLNIQFEKLSTEEVCNLIKILPYPYSDIGISRKRPTMPNTKSNLELIKRLSGKGLISSFEVKDQEIRIVANY